MLSKCPICEGRGLVPQDFYTCINRGGYGSSTSTGTVACKSCCGMGYIREDSQSTLIDSHNWWKPVTPTVTCDCQKMRY